MILKILSPHRLSQTSNIPVEETLRTAVQASRSETDVRYISDSESVAHVPTSKQPSQPDKAISSNQEQFRAGTVDPLCSSSLGASQIKQGTASNKPIYEAKLLSGSISCQQNEAASAQDNDQVDEVERWQGHVDDPEIPVEFYYGVSQACLVDTERLAHPTSPPEYRTPSPTIDEDDPAHGFAGPETPIDGSTNRSATPLAEAWNVSLGPDGKKWPQIHVDPNITLFKRREYRTPDSPPRDTWESMENVQLEPRNNKPAFRTRIPRKVPYERVSPETTEGAIAEAINRYQQRHMPTPEVQCANRVLQQDNDHLHKRYRRSLYLDPISSSKGPKDEVEDQTAEESPGYMQGQSSSDPRAASGDEQAQPPIFEDSGSKRATKDKKVVWRINGTGGWTKHIIVSAMMSHTTRSVSEPRLDPMSDNDLEDFDLSLFPGLGLCHTPEKIDVSWSKRTITANHTSPASEISYSRDDDQEAAHIAIHRVLTLATLEGGETVQEPYSPTMNHTFPEHYLSEGSDQSMMLMDGFTKRAHDLRPKWLQLTTRAVVDQLEAAAEGRQWNHESDRKTPGSPSLDQKLEDVTFGPIAHAEHLNPKGNVRRPSSAP